MPYYPDEPLETDFEAKANAPATTAEDRTFATSYMAGLDRTPGAATAAMIGGSVVDLLDTVASSVIPGIERQEVNNKFLSVIGSPGLTRYVDENRGAIEVGSGLVGVVVADMVAKRVLAPGSMAMKAVRGIPYVQKIATLDAQYDRAVRLAQLTTREHAAQGMIGIERFAGAQMNLASLGTKPLVTSGQFAKRTLFAANRNRGLARNLTTEGIMAATLHTNDFLYSDELSHNLAWMGFGLAAGTQIDAMVSAYTLRKIANADSIRRLNAAAYDVTGLESQRLHSSDVADRVLREAGVSPDDLGHMFTGAGATTDKITSLAISASELKAPRSMTERGQALFTKREAIATPHLNQAFEELNKVTTRGISGVSRAGFGTKLEGLGAPLKESIAREPGILYGIEEIGTTVDNMTRQQVVELRAGTIDRQLEAAEKLLENNGKWVHRRNRGKAGETFTDELIPFKEGEREALESTVKELKFKKTHVPMTMLEPGEWAPIELGRIADDYQPKAIVENGGLGPDNTKLWEREKVSKGDPHLAIRSDGELFLPGNGKLETLGMHDMLGLYNLANKAVRDFAATGTQFTLPKKPNWFQLDMAEQILKATGDAASVVFPGKMTRQTAQVESFAQKVSALRKRELSTKLASREGVAAKLDDVKAFEQKVFFNLPRLTSYQAGLLGSHDTPLDLLLAGFRSGDEVRQMSHIELLKAMNDSKRIASFTEETADSIDSLQGNSFNFLMDRDGTAIKPIIAYKRPMQPFEWTRDELFVRQSMKHSQVREALVGESADPITREIVSAILSNPNAAEARKVMELADDQQRSMVPGFRESAPQTTAGALINAVTSRERRDVDSLVMRGASIVNEEASRVTGAIMRQVIQESMGDTITVVNSARNVQSKLLLNQFHSFRQGWELAREPVEVTLPGSGKGYKFVLDHESAANKKRFADAFNRDIQKGQFLTSPNGTEIVLDELGMDVQKRLQSIHAVEIAMKNTLLRSQGLPEIKMVPWYVPPPQTKGKYLGFTFDMQDNLVADMSVIADSPEELASMKSELMKSQSWKPGYSFRQREEVESFMTLWDKAQMDWIAPNTTAIQPKKHNFGKTSGGLLNTNAFDEALVTIRDNIVKHGSDVLEVLFDDPIKAAYSRSKIARVESAVGDRGAAQHSSIYDRYVQNLLGRNALGAKDSFFGDAFDWAERRLDGMLASGPAKSIGDTYQGLKDFLRVSNPKNPVQGEKFNNLAKSLGQYMPFKSAMEMAERESGSRQPWQTAELTAKLSWFEAASRLRWFESMHAVVNFGSLLANTPAIIKALQPMAGETIEEAAKRNSSLVMMMGTPDGKSIGVVHTPKLMWNAMRDAWKKVPDEFTKKAIRGGYMDQEVAEFSRQWGSIDSKEGWRAFVFGDEAAEGTGFNAKLKRSGGIDKWMGVLSDKSEAFSRQWGMYMGRRVAETLGITNVDQQVTFAHDLTNKLIANYDPRNRPEVFQGALGAPLGLFQSYVMNYYQRMFRYLETGNVRAIATQYAAQSAVFGVGSVPGWDALNWAFFDNQQAENDDPVDSLYRRFGTADGDLIMHGALSSLPKIFGMDGVSLYTRGDTQFRMPANPVGAMTDSLGITNGNAAGNLPVADTMKRLVQGMMQGWSTLKETGGISWNQIAEIASNTITNRPLAGMLETGAANGYDTSWDGQVISQARTGGESLFRILGVRSMRQQKEIEMFYANKNAMEEQNARKTTLRLTTRAAIRNGDYSRLPTLFQDYVEAGGDPRGYTRWVKESFSSALDSRGERQLTKALKDGDGSKDALIGRLLDSQIDISEDDLSDDDYGRQAEIDSLISRGWEDNPEPEASQELDQPPEESISF